MSLILWESSLLDASTKKRLKSVFDKLEHLTLAVRKPSISFHFQRTFLLAMSSLRKMPSYYLPLMIRATVEHLLIFFNIVVHISIKSQAMLGMEVEVLE